MLFGENIYFCFNFILLSKSCRNCVDRSSDSLQVELILVKWKEMLVVHMMV